MKKIVVIMVSLNCLSLTAMKLDTDAITTAPTPPPLIDHGQVSKAINKKDSTQLLKQLEPLIQALKQIEAQGTAPASNNDSPNKDKAPTTSTTVPTDIELQSNDNPIDDIITMLMPLVDMANPTNLSSLVTQAESIAKTQAQKAASPINNMSAGRRIITGFAALLASGASVYTQIYIPISKKEESTTTTGIVTAGALLLYGLYDIYLGFTNRDAKADAAHAQVAANTLKDLHTKAQTVVATSPRSVAQSPGITISLTPSMPVEPTNLIDLNAQVKTN